MSKLKCERLDEVNSCVKDEINSVEEVKRLGLVDWFEERDGRRNSEMR